MDPRQQHGRQEQHEIRTWALPLALGIDLGLGDPPNRFHPVAWMGSWIAAWKRHRPEQQPAAEFLYGAFLTISGAGLAALAGGAAAWLARRLPPPLGCLLEAAVLKTALSLRGLGSAAAEIEAALQGGDLPAARRLLAWHLVSRDTSHLTEAQTAAAAIESVAENASDGVVAPLFYYHLGGLPLALAYRFVNTCDAMLGYHDPQHEWLGKFPARLDDLLNLIPARFTAGLEVLAFEWTDRRGRQAWQAVRREARKTESPNAGFPMSAMAGGLGCQLEKVGYYRLGEGLPDPSHPDLGRARRILGWTAGLAAAVFLLLSLGRKLGGWAYALQPEKRRENERE